VQRALDSNRSRPRHDGFRTTSTGVDRGTADTPSHTIGTRCEIQPEAALRGSPCCCLRPGALLTLLVLAVEEAITATACVDRTELVPIFEAADSRCPPRACQCPGHARCRVAGMTFRRRRLPLVA